jgi:hypothetical protein
MLGIAWRNLILTMTVTGARVGLAAEVPSPGAPLPGLESDPPGSVTPRSAAVTLRDSHVTLDLAVSVTPEATGLLLNGPHFGWLGAAERYPARHFPELEIRLNGAVVAPQDRFEAMVGRTNITNLIKAADMDPWAVARNPPVTTAHPRNPQILNALRNSGAIADTDAPAGADGAYTAKWVVRRMVVVPLSAAADVPLQLDYDARPGVALSTDALATSSLGGRYCLAGNALRRLQSRPGKNPAALTEYDIATGIDGKAPSTVTFSMRGSSRMAFWCGPAGRSMARRGTADRERASADAAGVLHVLTIDQ